jgi:hypothetical protein
VSPEILPGRQWAFSRRYFRRKKSVYRYIKTTLSSQILGTLDFALLVCCVPKFRFFYIKNVLSGAGAGHD